jgi:MFS family permease
MVYDLAQRLQNTGPWTPSLLVADSQTALASGAVERAKYATSLLEVPILVVPVIRPDHEDGTSRRIRIDRRAFMRTRKLQLIGRSRRLSIGGDFAKFWLGQTISNLGSSFTTFALPLLVFKLTGSPINLGVTSAATFAPYLVFGLVIGAWVDRVDRKRLMVATDLARALIIALIPVLATTGQLTVWWVYAIAFANSTLTIAFNAAEFAAIPSLVDKDDLVTANGRIQASYSVANVAGPLLAGLLITAHPIQQVLLLDALSFVISAGSLALIGRAFNVAPSGDKPRQAIRHDIADGLRYVLGHPVLRSISLMMALMNLIDITVYAQLVVVAKDRLRASDPQVGFLYAAGSIGVVLLSLAAGRLRRRLPFSHVALGSMVVYGLMIVVFASIRWYWVALPLWAAISGLSILFNINTASLRQQIVPNDLLGRVMSVAAVLAWSAIPIGSLLGGAAIEWTGNVALVYGAIGLLDALLAIGFWFSPLGHAERYLPADDTAGRDATGSGA